MRVWSLVFLCVFLFVPITTGAERVRIIDGDTMAVGETRYRLHGIDAPEAGQSCNDASGGYWPCGDEATEFLTDLIGTAMPQCSDEGADGFGRVLAVCEVEGIDLNAAMITSGFAWAFRKYSLDYTALEDQTRLTKVGIWRAPTETPWEFREKRWVNAAQNAPDGCPIKGNISDNGHIYHAPWSPWYDRTKISLEKGERWFCDELEATQAGWRAPIWGR